MSLCIDDRLLCKFGMRLQSSPCKSSADNLTLNLFYLFLFSRPDLCDFRTYESNANDGALQGQSKSKKSRPHKGSSKKLRGRSYQDDKLQIKEYSENFRMYIRNIGR
jgi:hypothetical protein